LRGNAKGAVWRRKKGRTKMSIDQFLLCDKCGYREVRKAGTLYPSKLPTYCDQCNQLLKSEPLVLDNTTILSTFTAQSGKNVTLERIDFNCALVILCGFRRCSRCLWYRVTIDLTRFWFPHAQRDAAFEMSVQLRYETAAPLFLEVEQKG
jgi:hypothetical protein